MGDALPLPASGSPAPSLSPAPHRFYREVPSPPPRPRHHRGPDPTAGALKRPLRRGRESRRPPPTSSAGPRSMAPRGGPTRGRAPFKNRRRLRSGSGTRWRRPRPLLAGRMRAEPRPENGALGAGGDGSCVLRVPAFGSSEGKMSPPARSGRFRRVLIGVGTRVRDPGTTDALKPQ